MKIKFTNYLYSELFFIAIIVAIELCPLLKIE